MSIAFLLQTTLVFAVSEIRNGGHVIICTNADGTKSYEVIDGYEAKMIDLVKINLGAEDLNPQEKALIAVERLKEVDPERYQMLKDKINNFFSFASLIPNFRPTFIDDSFLVGTPPNCSLRQFAVQRRNATGMSVLIDGDLWNEIKSTDQQAILILHEVVYELFINIGEENSANTRIFMNRILSEGDPLMSNPEEYRNFLSRLNPKFGWYYHGIPLEIDSFTISENGIESGVLAHSVPYTVSDQVFLLSYPQARLHFREDGTLSQFEFSNTGGFYVHGCSAFFINPPSGCQFSRVAYTSPDNKIESIKGCSATELDQAQLCAYNHPLLFSGVDFYFHENFTVKSGHLARDTVYMIGRNQFTLKGFDDLKNSPTIFDQGGDVRASRIVNWNGNDEEICLKTRSAPNLWEPSHICHKGASPYFEFDRDGYPIK